MGTKHVAPRGVSVASERPCQRPPRGSRKDASAAKCDSGALRSTHTMMCCDRRRSEGRAPRTPRGTGAGRAAPARSAPGKPSPVGSPLRGTSPSRTRRRGRGRHAQAPGRPRDRPVRGHRQARARVGTFREAADDSARGNGCFQLEGARSVPSRSTSSPQLVARSATRTGSSSDWAAAGPARVGPPPAFRPRTRRAPGCRSIVDV